MIILILVIIRLLISAFNGYERYDWIEARYALDYKLFFKEMTIKECRKLAKAGVKFR